MAPILKVRQARFHRLKTKMTGKSTSLSPHGKKRAAFEDWEEKAPKRGKMPSPGGSVLPLEHCVGFPQRGRDDAAK